MFLAKEIVQTIAMSFIPKMKSFMILFLAIELTIFLRDTMKVYWD